MEYRHQALRQQSSAATQSFAQLGSFLQEVAKGLSSPGVLPAEPVVEKIAAARKEFEALRNDVQALAAEVLISPLPRIEELSSLEAVATLLGAAAKAEEARSAFAGERAKAVEVLDRILSIRHRENPAFQPLADCLRKATEIRKGIASSQWPRPHHEAGEVLGEKHPLTALLSLVVNREALDDERWMELEETVTKNYGKQLSVAASRGKLELEARAATAPVPAATPVPAEAAATKPAPAKVEAAQPGPARPEPEKVDLPRPAAAKPVPAADVPSPAPAPQPVSAVAEARPAAVAEATPAPIAEPRAAAPDEPPKAEVPKVEVARPVPVAEAPKAAEPPAAAGAPKPIEAKTAGVKADEAPKAEPVAVPVAAVSAEAVRPAAAPAPAAVAEAPRPAPVAVTAPVGEVHKPAPAPPPVPPSIVEPKPAQVASAVATAPPPIPPEAERRAAKEPRLAVVPVPPKPADGKTLSEENLSPESEEARKAAADAQRPQRWGFWRGNR